MMGNIIVYQNEYTVPGEIICCLFCLRRFDVAAWHAAVIEARLFRQKNITDYYVILLPERDYLTFGSLLSQIANRSVVCLSAMFVRAIQWFRLFSNISSPLCTLAILCPPCKILRRSSQGNPSVVKALNARGVSK